MTSQLMPAVGLEKEEEQQQPGKEVKAASFLPLHCILVSFSSKPPVWGNRLRPTFAVV